MEEIGALIFARDLDQIKEALSSRKFKVNDFISHNRSALALAAACNYLEVINCILDQGADIDLNNNDDLGYTPLETAAREGQLAAVQLLVERGASLDKGNTKASTALIGACIGAHKDILVYLIEKGAAINHSDNEGQTALHYLCRFAKQCGSNVITQIIDGVTTILPNPKFQEHTAIFNLLLNHGADPNLLTAYGYTPLHLASESDAPIFIKPLVEKGAAVNAQNAKGFAPLHAACDRGNFNACKELIENGANVNIVDADGFTPILGATSAQNIKLVKYLLDQGATTTTPAKISYENVKEGDNALSLAVRLANEELLALFFKE